MSHIMACTTGTRVCRTLNCPNSLRNSSRRIPAKYLLSQATIRHYQIFSEVFRTPESELSGSIPHRREEKRGALTCNGENVRPMLCMQTSYCMAALHRPSAPENLKNI